VAVEEAHPVSIFPIDKALRSRIDCGLACLIIFPLIVGLLGLSLGKPVVVIAGLLLALFLTPIGFWLWRSRHSQLRVDDHGIHFERVLGSKPVFLPWQMLLRFQGTEKLIGLVLKEPLDNPILRQQANANRFALNQSSNQETVARLLAEQRWITLHSFGDRFLEDAWKESLERWAPHLVESSHATASRRRKPSRYRTILTWLSVGLALFGLLSGGLWLVVYFVDPTLAEANGLALIGLRIGQLILALAIGFMVLSLTYLAMTNFRDGFREARRQDYSSALTSVSMACLQAVFAGWIAWSILQQALRPVSQ
jgi:hypothetical protein